MRGIPMRWLAVDICVSQVSHTIRSAQLAIGWLAGGRGKKLRRITSRQASGSPAGPNGRAVRCGMCLVRLGQLVRLLTLPWFFRTPWHQRLLHVLGRTPAAVAINKPQRRCSCIHWIFDTSMCQPMF